MLFDALDHCVKNQVPPEQLAQALSSSVPPEALGQIAGADVIPARIAEGFSILGKPDLAQKLREPAYQSYLEQLLKVLRARLPATCH